MDKFDLDSPGPSRPSPPSGPVTVLLSWREGGGWHNQLQEHRDWGEMLFTVTGPHHTQEYVEACLLVTGEYAVYPAEGPAREDYVYRLVHVTVRHGTW